jgi:hypothetical protein
MGQPKTTSSTAATTTPGPTAEETAMNKLQLQQYTAFEPQQTEMYKNAFGLGNQLLTSFGNKDSNMWKSLIGGVTDEQQQRMITEQDRYLKPQLQAQGIYDSGTAATGRMRAATDLANQNAQFNVGALQNALNLALSGQAQVQSPAQGMTSSLSNQLAGLRSNQATSNVTNRPMNPFLQSFATQAGSSLGGANSTGFCWVAAEIFGGWDEPKTVAVRYYIGNIAPKWFKNFYIKYGERIAKFIHNKPVLKMILRPLFEHFASKVGGVYAY